MAYVISIGSLDATILEASLIFDISDEVLEVVGKVKGGIEISKATITAPTANAVINVKGTAFDIAAALIVDQVNLIGPANEAEAPKTGNAIEPNTSLYITGLLRQYANILKPKNP